MRIRSADDARGGCAAVPRAGRLRERADHPRRARHVAARARGRNRTCPPKRARSSDVTGAGDTVIAALALGLAAGASLADAAPLANRAAGIVVGKFGPATVHVENCGSIPEQADGNPSRHAVNLTRTGY